MLRITRPRRVPEVPILSDEEFESMLTAIEARAVSYVPAGECVMCHRESEFSNARIPLCEPCLIKPCQCEFCKTARAQDTPVMTAAELLEMFRSGARVPATAIGLVMALKRDASGRRIYRTETQALRRQRTLMLYNGIWTGAVHGPNGWYLLHDPQTNE
jgi:hypothetical protein